MPFLLSTKGIPGTGSINNTLIFGNAFPDITEPPTTTEQSRSGWNFIGNPYPSNLDWKTIADDISGTAISNAYYTWNGTTYLSRSGASATDDGTGDAPLQIPPGKGFFVKAEEIAAASSTFYNFTNTDRTSTRAPFEKTESNQLRLIAKVEQDNQDAFFVAFRDIATATSGFDPQHDAYKLFSPLVSAVQIFQTPDMENNEPALAIQVLPEGFEHYSVPISVSLKEISSITLSLDKECWERKNWVFYLEDLESEEWYNLESDYNFQSNGTPQRFQLHLFTSSQVVPPRANENEAFIWFNRNDQLAINVHLDENIQKVAIYNISGQLLFNGDNFFDNEITIDKRALSGYGQFIIVEVITDKAVYTKRVFKH
jgi:hypothetical protein